MNHQRTSAWAGRLNLARWSGWLPTAWRAYNLLRNSLPDLIPLLQTVAVWSGFLILLWGLTSGRWPFLQYTEFQEWAAEKYVRQRGDMNMQIYGICLP